MAKAAHLGGQKHPLDSSGFFSNLFFSWLNPLLKFTKSNMFRQEHHYEIAGEDAVRRHRSRVAKGLRERGGFLAMVTHEYRLKLLEYSFAAIISALLLLSSGKLMTSVSSILKNERLSDLEVIKKLGLLLGLNIICISMSLFLK